MAKYKTLKLTSFTMAAVLMFLSITFGMAYKPSHTYAAQNDIEESESVELFLNYSNIKVIYGTKQYLSDIEVFNASGAAINLADVEWMSDDESVATVKYGTIFIQGPGETFITALYNGNTASLYLKVVEPKVSINKSELKDRLVGDKCTDWYNSTEGIKVTAKSSNKKVVKINDDGSLKILALGKSKIAVKAKNGNTATYTMNVNKRHAYVTNEEVFGLEEYIKCIDNYQNAIWTASEPGYIENIPDGTMKPLKSGKVTLSTNLNGETYKVVLRITNYNMMKELALSSLKDTLRYPASLSINSITHNGRKITIDYSSMNKYGGYDRKKFILKINMAGKYTSKTVSIYD